MPSFSDSHLRTLLLPAPPTPTLQICTPLLSQAGYSPSEPARQRGEGRRSGGLRRKEQRLCLTDPLPISTLTFLLPDASCQLPSTDAPAGCVGSTHVPERGCLVATLSGEGKAQLGSYFQLQVSSGRTGHTCQSHALTLLSAGRTQESGNGLLSPGLLL